MPGHDEQTVEVLHVGEVAAGWQPAVGNVTSQLRDYLLNRHVLPTPESADRVINEAARVLSQCAPPTAVTPAEKCSLEPLDAGELK